MCMEWRSHFKLRWIKESFAERATCELGLGEQVWFGSKRRDWQTIACRPNPFPLPVFRNRVVLVLSHAHSLMCPLWLLSCNNGRVLYSPQSLKNYFLDLYRKCLWSWFKVSSFGDLIDGLDVWISCKPKYMTSSDRYSGKQNASEPWEYWSVQDGTELQDRGCGRWAAEERCHW